SITQSRGIPSLVGPESDSASHSLDYGPARVRAVGSGDGRRRTACGQAMYPRCKCSEACDKVVLFPPRQPDFVTPYAGSLVRRSTLILLPEQRIIPGKSTMQNFRQFIMFSNHSITANRQAAPCCRPEQSYLRSQAGKGIPTSRVSENSDVMPRRTGAGVTL